MISSFCEPAFSQDNYCFLTMGIDLMTGLVCLRLRRLRRFDTSCLKGLTACSLFEGRCLKANMKFPVLQNSGNIISIVID